MKTTASFFLPITKIDKTPEGHRLVSGMVSTERVDLDGQIADYGWAKKEAQAWFDIANVREQHSRNAVGKGLDLTLADETKTIALMAKVVDPTAIAKLDEGIYTGFSFGAKSVPGNPIKVVKDAQAPGGRIVGGKWIEISLADRPANPDSVLTIAKAAGAALEVDDALGEFADEDVDKVVEADEGKTPAPAPVTEKQLTGGEAMHNAPVDAARSAIRQMISQEAGEAEAGNTYQLGYLIDALQAIDGFVWSEADESYSAMVVEMAAVVDKDARRALYKDVAGALQKIAAERKEKTVTTEVKPDGTKPTTAEAEPASATAVETPAADATKLATADTEKFLTADTIKAVLPDQLKAMLPELLKEHKQVLKEALAETFAGKELEKTVETLGRRAQPGGPMMSTDATGLRAIEKAHPVNDALEPGEVPLEALQEMAKYSELSKVDDVLTAQSARRMLAKLQKVHGLSE